MSQKRLITELGNKNYQYYVVNLRHCRYVHEETTRKGLITFVRWYNIVTAFKTVKHSFSEVLFNMQLVLLKCSIV